MFTVTDVSSCSRYCTPSPLHALTEAIEVIRAGRVPTVHRQGGDLINLVELLRVVAIGGEPMQAAKRPF